MNFDTCIKNHHESDSVIGVQCMFAAALSPLPLSLSAQLIEADGCTPRAWFCPRFLPVKREFFVATVAKCLLMMGTVGAL